MVIQCEYCGHENLDVILEYSFDIVEDEAEHFEIGTINAVCMNCNKEQYLKEDELPKEVRSNLIQG